MNETVIIRWLLALIMVLSWFILGYLLRQRLRILTQNRAVRSVGVDPELRLYVSLGAGVTLVAFLTWFAV